MPRTNNATEAAPPTGRSNKLLQARHAATATLIAENKARFDELYVKEAEARGVTYTPEPTEEQKAALRMEELIKEHPELEDQLRHRYGPAEPVELKSPEPGDPAT